MGEKLKKMIGIKGGFKESIVPMINYCYTNSALSGAGYIISMYFTIFLTEVVNLSLPQASFVVMLATVWDAVSDPVMGIITDRTRSRTGRHRRYLLLGIPVLMISYIMMWNSFGISAEENPSLCVVYYAAAYMLYKTAYTIIDVPHVAMLPELAPEYDQRTQYVSMSYIFNSLGMIPSYIILLIMLRAFGSAGQISAEKSREPFFFTGIALSVFYGVCVFLTYRLVKERSSLEDKREPFDLKFFINEYVLVFKNRSFRQYFFMSLFWQFSTGFYNTSKVYYIKYLANQYSKYAIINTLAGVFESLAFPLNYALTMKYGKQKCGTIVTPLMIVGLAIGLFMQPSQSGTTMGTMMFLLMILSIMLYPFGMSGLGFVANNVLPDLSDVDELITGRRREGVISTFNTLIKKSVSGAMAMMVGLILNGFGLVTGKTVADFEAANGINYQQTSSALLGIRICVAVIPIIAACISWYLLKKFHMTKDDHTMIRAAVATKHKYGSVTLSPEEIERVEIVTGQKYADTWLGRDNDESQPHTLDKNSEGEYSILVEKAAEMKASLSANET